MQQLVADAAVLADGGGDLLHVGAEALAQIGDLVDEADVQGEEGIGHDMWNRVVLPPYFCQEAAQVRDGKGERRGLHQGWSPYSGM